MSEVNLTHKGALEEGQIGIHRLSGLAPEIYNPCLRWETARLFGIEVQVNICEYFILFTKPLALFLMQYLHVNPSYCSLLLFETHIKLGPHKNN